MLVFRLQHVSSRVSGFALSMGEAAKPLLFEGVKVPKLEEVSHEMLLLMLQHCLVSGLGLSCGFAVSMGEAAKPFLYTSLHALHFAPNTPQFTLHTIHFTL